MTPERWQQVKGLLAATLEIDPAERAAYLDKVCGGDSALRAELDELLAVNQAADPELLNTPAMAVAFEGNPGAHARIGRRIGPYQIIEEIGVGGMGEVYRAFRADDQYRKQVAIKLVRTGQESNFVVARFKNERQVLASLDHPNIARLLDGGTTEDGVPYFVMELIEGQSIHDYCDDHKLPTTERLKLFLQVCSAVQYAHQRLIIHRDLKPSNILVTREGIPKLLDFGIAKILDPAAVSEVLEPTMSMFRLLTPRYASPEQIKGEAITTASDVYSLGVLLYELLTGHRPYLIAGHAPHDIAQAVCEFEPERPSTVLWRTGERETVDGWAEVTPASISSVRDGSPEKLSRRLRGDLDNIILMALRKDPQRRYASAEQFAEDIRRHLESLPVSARTDSVRYRMSKFIARHKAGVAAAILVGVTVLGGLGATLHEAHVAQRRFNDVRELANSLVFDVHDAIQFLPGATPVRKLLVSKALTYLDSLAHEAGGDPTLQRELVAAYEKLGDVQGFMGKSNLGDPAGALQSYRKALAIAEPLCVTHKNAQVCDYVAKIYYKLGQVSLRTMDNANALQYFRKSLATAQDILTKNPASPQARKRVANSYDGMGDVFVALNNLDQAGQSYQKDMEIFEALREANPANTGANRDLSVSYKKVGGIFEATGRIPEALEKYRQALTIDESLSANDPTNALLRSDLSISYTNLGDILSRLGRAPEAIERYRQALAIDETLAAADPDDTRSERYVARTSEKIGKVLMQSGNAAESTSYFRRALTVANQLSGREPLLVRSDVAAYSSGLGEAYAQIAASAPPDKKRERWQQACSWYRRSLDIWEDLRRHGAVSPRDDGETPEKASEGMTKCNAALTELSASSLTVRPAR